MAVNVIIPVYNTDGALFKRALHSLSCQTKRGFYVTVVDDCSDIENSKRYQEIIDSFVVPGNNFQISYERLEENCGPGYAKEVGIKLNERCDYVMFLDADDMLYPNAVDLLYLTAKTKDADVVNSQVLLQGPTCLNDYTIETSDNIGWDHGKIYSVDFLNDLDIHYPESKVYNEDVYFNTQCLLLADNIIRIETPTYLWSNNKDSITRQEDFSKNNCMSYFDILVDVIDVVLEKNSEANIGGTFGALYNAYNMVMIERGGKNEDSLYMLKRIGTLGFNYPQVGKLIEQFDDVITKEMFKDSIATFKIRDRNGVFYRYTVPKWLNRCQWALNLISAGSNELSSSEWQFLYDMNELGGL